MKQASKFLSYVLRHEPDAIGLQIDAQGWASIEDLITLTQGRELPLSRELIESVVAMSDKQRFSISPDGLRIRANQGHSIAVDLGLQPVRPPETLFHGTATRFLESIRSAGLQPQERQHVHLSPDAETATRVGQRHGKPVVLQVRAAALFDAGTPFYLSENGVWLTPMVPLEYLIFP
ncbi:MAG TPA: RNA 2'-phosphotransferase [Candidatus Eisenbacteria bacterium]|nr:RNA 2'-phosphotransferase [Candidatus Eisenbacteria bacterium]